MTQWGKIVPLEETTCVKVCRQERNGTDMEGVIAINSVLIAHRVHGGQVFIRNGSWRSGLNLNHRKPQCQALACHTYA